MNRFRRAIKPPKRLTRCPDCRGGVRLTVKSNGTGWDTWRCRNLRGCGSSGVVLTDGHIGVLERYLVRHKAPVPDLGVRVLPRIVPSGLRPGYVE